MSSWSSRQLLVLLFAAAAVGWSDPIGRERASVAHRPLRGEEFPDGVLALTWDDGPDVHTTELARFLHDEGVHATFFAVEAWKPGVSEEPGVGDAKFATGYAALPVLDDLVALGHRVGSHTRNHVLLGHATPELAAAQIDDGVFRGTAARFFRAPAGWWTDESTRAFAGRDDLVGPVHWDLDAKDWEGSLYCRSSRPETECEPGPAGPRVRAEVTAERYFQQITEAKHGIVLFHDRVGAVGSTYALDVARALVPRLVAAHFVFVAPQLRFGRTVATARTSHSHGGDVNGDGFVDTCTSSARGVECALGDGVGFKAASVWWPVPLDEFALADADGDGRADLCFGGRCALAP